MPLTPVVGYLSAWKRILSSAARSTRHVDIAAAAAAHGGGGGGARRRRRRRAAARAGSGARAGGRWRSVSGGRVDRFTTRLGA
jgi:hypothetical protein